MTHAVSDDQYGKLHKRLDEVARRIKQGTIPFDDSMRALTLIAEGDIPTPTFIHDMRKERGWELEVEGPKHPHDAELELVEVELRYFDETHRHPTNLVERAKELGATLGQHTVEYLFGHSDYIPDEWKRQCLMFPGTVWCDKGGPSQIPELLFANGRWQIVFSGFIGWYKDEILDRGVMVLRSRE